MSGFSEQLMRERLQKLSNSIHSIQTLSAWLVHHSRKYADTILDCWLKEVRNNSENERLISLINLANDVIQNSRKRGPEFMGAFYEVLQPAFIHAAECMDEHHRKMLDRIIVVWRDRQIYSAKQLDELAKCLVDNSVAISPSVKPTESPLLSNNNNIGKKELNSPVAVAKQQAKSSGSSPNAIAPSSTKTGAASSISKQKEGKEEFQAFSTLSTNVVAMLRKLEDPASADVKIRQLIAAYPESIANPALLKQLKSQEELTALQDKIAEATPVVDVYCNRLREELKDRQGFQYLMDDYTKALAEANERNQQLLVSVKRRIARLDEEKKELARHIESLPDLAEMFGSGPGGTAPQLPSLGELFTPTT